MGFIMRVRSRVRRLPGPQGVNRKDPKVSPLFATDLADLAPARIVTADHDPLRDEGEEYAAKLRRQMWLWTTLAGQASFMGVPRWLESATQAGFSSSAPASEHFRASRVQFQLILEKRHS
jgi:hypothetical protein